MLASAKMHSHIQHEHRGSTSAPSEREWDMSDLDPLNPQSGNETQQHRRFSAAGLRLNVVGRAPQQQLNRLHVVEERSEREEAPTIDENENENDDEKADKAESWKLKYARLILPHIGLVVMCVLYTVAGATLFYLVEKPHEIRVRRDGLKKISERKSEILQEMWMLSRERAVDETDFTLIAHSRLDNLTKMLFEVFTERYVTIENLKIFFGLFGVPLMLVTIADMGKFISDGIVWCYHKYRRLKRRLVLRRIQLMRNSSFSRMKLTRERDQTHEDLVELSMDNESALDDDEPPIPVTIVLLIIVGYTALGGFLLQLWEPWNFFESFYFCFITMTTVGFGDLVPKGESYYFITLLYIVLGLAITTMCVDLVGSQYIRKIHFFGRKIQNARDALRSMGEVMRYATFLRKKYGLTDDQLRQMQILPPGLSTDDWMNHYSSKTWKDLWKNAFVPKDIGRIYYIDQRTESIRDSIRDSTIQDGGSARIDANSLASNRVHF